MLAAESARLECNSIPIEQRIKLEEGSCAGALAADQEQIALGERGLNGRNVDGLKQLRLEQLADPGDLVARQNRIRIGQKPMSGKVSRIDVDGFPSFHQGKLLETHISVDSAKGCASCRQVRIEQQTRSVNCPVVV